jgi:O-antigen/teichoic acid export membrane protein
LPLRKVIAVRADEALAEMDRRQQQTLRQGSPRRFPAWFTYGTAAGLTLIWAGSDLTGLAGGGVAGVGVIAIVALTTALERVTGVRLRMRALRWTPLALLTVAIMVTAIVAGSVMRLLDVPAAGTIGGLAAAVVWVVGLGPVQAAAATRPRPA